MISSNALKQSIANAIYGGPIPKDSQLLQFIKQNHLPLPGDVIAFSDSRLLPIPSPDLPHVKPVALRLHAGIVYAFQPALYKNRPSPTIHYSRPREFIMAIQQAILVLRQTELKQLHQTAKSQPAGRTDFTLQEEKEAFYLALQAIQKDPKGASPAVEVWGQIILHRHQKYLHSIRLKLIELIAALTHGQDIYQVFPCYNLIQQILVTHRLKTFTEFPLRIAKEVGPLVKHTPNRSKTAYNYSPAVEKAFEYMKAHFEQPISLAQVAQATHVSSAHLSRLFRYETGHTIVEHLHRLRIHHAQELLVTTSQFLVEIALDCGFESIEHFYRIFRRYTGTTPRIYRKQSQNIFTHPLTLDE